MGDQDKFVVSPLGGIGMEFALENGVILWSI